MLPLVVDSLASLPKAIDANLTTIFISSVAILTTFLITRVMTNDEIINEPNNSKNCKDQGPRPRWEILGYLNYIVLGVFIGSITYIQLNYDSYDDITSSISSATIQGEMNDDRSKLKQMLPLIILWSCCLVYFFGFFGISFIDKNEMVRSPSSFGLEDMAGELKKMNGNLVNNNDKEQDEISLSKKRNKELFDKKAKPMHDAPLCSEIRKGGNVNNNMMTNSSNSNVNNSTNKTESDNKIANLDFEAMSDEELLSAIKNGKMRDYELEKKCKNYEKAVRVRRQLYEERIGRSFHGLPYEGYDYEKIFGANCEIVLGYLPVPVGIIGPLILDGEPVYIPMATTEGCLVASANRGCKAINGGGGCTSILLKDGITRAPLVKMNSAAEAAKLKFFIEDPDTFLEVKKAFESTTSFGKLKTVTVTCAGRNAWLRFVCQSGDAMGMNMISKGCLKVMELLEEHFPTMQLISLSGNMCTDKKPSAVNWLEGRGKSIICESFIPGDVVQTVLKTTCSALVETNRLKNHVGSAMAGSVGGFNAHASNIVSAVFLACGQDIAQNVESSNCITIIEEVDDGIHISVTMPSIEVGTVGGGTHLAAQAACLDIVGCRGASKAPKVPGENAQKLARVVAGSVMAGELSLLSALAANHLVKSHMQHNRKTTAATK